MTDLDSAPGAGASGTHDPEVLARVIDLLDVVRPTTGPLPVTVEKSRAATPTWAPTLAARRTTRSVGSSR